MQAERAEGVIEGGADRGRAEAAAHVLLGGDDAGEPADLGAVVDLVDAALAEVAAGGGLLDRPHPVAGRGQGAADVGQLLVAGEGVAGEGRDVADDRGIVDPGEDVVDVGLGQRPQVDQAHGMTVARRAATMYTSGRMTPAVGADIESLCSKCGDVWHVIEAKVGDDIVRVLCKECGKQHRYKNPKKAGAAALVGEDGEVVDEVWVFWPARWDEPVGVPDVLVVEPGDDVVEPDPELEAQVRVGAAGWVPGSGEASGVAEGFDLFGCAVGGDGQLAVGVLDVKRSGNRAAVRSTAARG